MGTFTFNHPELLERDEKDIFFKNFGMIDLMYTMLFNTRTSTKAYEDGMRVAGLGTFHTKPEGTPVGFSLTLPDMNRALHEIRGRLWPWSIVRLLLAKRRIRRGRVITLGVTPAHRRAGLEGALILRSIDSALALGWDGAECSWVLDDNELMISAIERVGGVSDRRYRIYERPL